MISAGLWHVHSADLGVISQVKKKYFEQKKREQLVQEARRADMRAQTEMLVAEARSGIARFTGGGFNLNQSAA